MPLAATAEIIGQYMRKGRPFLVEGRLKLDHWEDKNTSQKQSKLGWLLETFSFIDSNRRRRRRRRRRAPQPASGASGRLPTAAPAAEPAESDAPPETRRRADF